MNSTRIVYLNGHFLPLDQANISVMDRGFLFGDGVYELIPIFNGRLFRPHEHLQRLKRSLEAIELSLVFEEEAYLSIIEELMRRNPAQSDTQAIYVQITRGASDDRNHTFPENSSPTVFAQCTEIKPMTFEELAQGARAITVEDIRWQWCYIKSINLLPNVLFAQQAKIAKAKEAILIRNGMAMEGSSSNLFIVKKGVIITPPADHQILRGIMRDVVLEIAAKHNLPYLEQNIPEIVLKEADEIWMTGSIKEILPITHVNDRPVRDGKVGPLWHKVIGFYKEEKNSLVDKDVVARE